MKVIFRASLIALAVLQIIATRVHAADSDSITQMFSFSGFGTVGVAHSSESQADFTSSVFKPDGAGYTSSWSASVDSLIGAQLTANFTSNLSAVVQIIVEQNFDNSYTPHVEWANLKYQFTPDISLRVGRTDLPVFLFSDTIKVGYTYPWLRPPVEVYSLLPNTQSDGADASYRVHAGDVSNTLEGNFGYTAQGVPHDRGTAYGNDSLSISDTIEYRSFTFRVSYERARLTLSAYDPFLNLFKLFGPQGIALADKYNSDSKIATLEVVSASYDPGRWFVISELGHAHYNSILGESTAGYVSAGYRVAAFTPFITYAQETAVGNFDPGLSLTGLPPALAAMGAGLNAGLNALLESIPASRTVSVGVRWDLMKNLDLKLQVDHTRLGSDSFGTLINIQPGYPPGGTVNLFGADINFVF
jgi:hypothetical protein